MKVDQIVDDHVQVEIISTQNIKPSSPTPDHLRHCRLSFLDQILPPLFMPLILFFHKDDALSNQERADVMKRSLSDVLTLFYPLAGRAKENSYIDCTDDGAHYVEARVNCNLADIINNPVPRMLNRLFLPLELDDVQELVIAVQVTFFDCGGLAMSLSMSHKIGDAQAYFTLLNSWAAMARGDPTSITTPVFDSANFFSPMDSMAGARLMKRVTKQEGVVSKRFVFNSATISSLQDKYTDTGSKRPSRVLALSAFLWSRYMRSTQLSNKPYTVLHMVNLRPKMDPPLPEHHFGNISHAAVTRPITDDGDNGYKVVNEVRNAIKLVDVEFVKKLRENAGDFLDQMKKRAQTILKGDMVSFNFSSLCRFPTYEADFGWGRPVWVGSGSLTHANVIVFLDTKEGEGIEVWVNLKEDDMTNFDKDKELQAYASS